MKNEILKWEIKKTLVKNSKIIWITSILVYILLIFTQNYTVNNQTLQETSVEGTMYVMRKVLYGGMSLYQAVLAIIVVAPIFSQEYDSNMYDTIKTVKYGHRFIVKTKLKVAFAIMLAYSLIYNGFTYIFFNFVLRWSIIPCINEYWKKGIVSQIFGNLAIVGMCCFISVMTKNVFSSVTVSALVIFLPIFIPGDAIQQYLKYFPIWSIQLETYEDIKKFIVIPIIDILIALACIFMIRIKKWK